MSYYADDTVTVHHGDCIDVLATLPDASVDAVVTDPPYGLEFMGKTWDRFDEDSKARAGMSTTGYTDGAERLQRPSHMGGLNPKCRNCQKWQRGGNPCTCDSPDFPNERRARSAAFGEWCLLWAAECLRVLKPGGHLLAFGGTRTSHRLTCAIEDAGFEIRDSLAWIHAQGFPKNLNVSKALDGHRCRCEMGEYDYGSAEGIDSLERREADNPLRTLRNDGEAFTQPSVTPVPRLLLDELPVEGECSGQPSGESVRLDGTDGDATVRPGQPGVEGRRDAQAGEGQLHGGQVHPLPAGVPGDGTSGRLHHRTPTSDGSVARPLPAANGSGQPQGPQPVEQHPREPGAVPVQRRPQAWGGWPVCERCSQPVIPDGLGTAAKPAHEPVVVARKPLSGTVAQTVLEHGTGALNVDGCRVGRAEGDRTDYGLSNGAPAGIGYHGLDGRTPYDGSAGRWPANVVLDESQAAALDQQSGESVSPTSVTQGGRKINGGRYNATDESAEVRRTVVAGPGDFGGASRFFYTAKADTAERVRIDGTAHPTVKPLALMRWLVRLVTPPGGTVLEPFAGSGTTVEACILEGFRCVAIEREADYLPLILQRVHRRRDPVAAVLATAEDGGLFDLLGEEPAS